MSRKTMGAGLLLLLVMGLGAMGLAVAGEPPGLAAAMARPGKVVIARAWHGKTLRARADEYEKYLAGAITKFPTIPGNLGYQLMRLDGGPDGDAYVEFQVISYWESLDAIKGYAGADITRTHDLPRDDEFLVGKEARVRNYQLQVDALRP